MEPRRTKAEVKEPEPEMLDEFEGLDVESLLPSMTVSKDMMMPEPKECIVGDEFLMGLYGEILTNCRNDRTEIDTVAANFSDMVMNEGDASSASKEAIVNLYKIKTDISDKMTKVADLMTRIKLKDKDTFPRYLAAQQNNKVVIEDHRGFLKSVQNLTSKKGGNDKPQA